MKSPSYRKQHTGVALVVALLFLLVVTVISLIAASNSSMGLKMSTNMADASASFQAAEAGVIAVLAMANDDANNPFTGQDNDTPFANFEPDDEDHPLSNLNDGVEPMAVEVFLTNPATNCAARSRATSADLIKCEFYRIESEHDVDRKARTKVTLGAVKEVIGG